nr:hypothetical protein [Tanacetum cinerariifolium]
MIRICQTNGIRLVFDDFKIMSQYHDDDEFMADEYEMEDLDDTMEEELYGRDIGSDSDVDEHDYMLKKKFENTTAAQARRGKDIQGIPWERLSITREKYRQTRLEQYKNYENIAESGKGSEKVCKVTDKTGLYYDFRQNSRSVKSTIFHFQLRNLVWATSKHNVYFMHNYSVYHWSS